MSNPILSKDATNLKCLDGSIPYHTTKGAVGHSMLKNLKMRCAGTYTSDDTCLPQADTSLYSAAA